MNILEQTETRLLMKDSVKSAWAIRLFSTPFFVLGGLGLILAISETIFPNLFVIFCVLVGGFGVFFTAVKTVEIDGTQKQLTLAVRRLLGGSKRTYPLNGVNVRVKKTAFRVKSYSSLFIQKREPIYVVVLEIYSASEKVYLSGNYSYTRNEAVKIANIARNFIDTSL